jgi:hypothetical protein
MFAGVSREWEEDRQRREAALVKQRQEQLDQTWVDPATKLMWTRKYNGSDVDWDEAMSYCRQLRLGRGSWGIKRVFD